MVLKFNNYIFHTILRSSAPPNVGLSVTNTLSEGFFAASITIDPIYCTHASFRFNWLNYIHNNVLNIPSILIQYFYML